MPKRTHKLLSFHGGINNDADPRDIADSQFADLQNVAVDEVGKIVVLGDIKTTQNHGTDLTLTGTLTGQGNGLFSISTDHDGFLDGTVATPGQAYYLVENGDTINGIGADGETGNIACTIGSAGPTMYYVDGALRIGDADHGGGTAPKWRGFIQSNEYVPQALDGNNPVTIPEAWYTTNANVAGAFPTFTYSNTTVCKNALMINVSYAASGEQHYSFDKDASTTTFDTDYNGVSSTGTSDHEWGVALEFAESSTGNGTGTWMPETTTRYKFFITTMYDDHKQESLPQLLRMWDTEQIDGGDSYNGKTITTELAFRAGDSATAAKNIAVYFMPVFKIVGNTNGLLNFGAAAVGTVDSGNQRISGNRIYWASNEDGYTNLWMLFDAKFDEGVRAIGIDGGGGGSLGYSPWKDHDNSDYSEHVKVDLDTSNVWSHPPKIFLYDDLAGHNKEEVIKVDSFKTAVVANRRAYIGNVEQDGEIHGDRILKSPVGEFDKFPKLGALDIIVEDGDEIVLLLEYADRILEFKKNTLYILNVSGDVEFLEAEYKFKGITNPGAACRTDYGCAWVNQNGCYMYDGKQVIDLLEDRGMRKINRSTWSTFISAENYHRIGFNPFKRQLIVLNGTNDANVLDDAYVYDMVTKSWTFSSSMISDGDSGSNFINDPVDGSLLIFDDGGETLDKWTDTPTANPSIVIITKDIDFGEPAVRKKVYKAYITYRSNSGTLPTTTYGVDGDSTPATATTAVTAFANTSNAWTRAEFTFGSDANNCKSIQLKIAGTSHTSFEINDITFVYRMKSIK